MDQRIVEEYGLALVKEVEVVSGEQGSMVAKDHKDLAPIVVVQVHDHLDSAVEKQYEYIKLHLLL